MVDYQTVAGVLGLKTVRAAGVSPFALMASIEHGLPVTSLERVSACLAPDDARFIHALVPRATLARRKAAADGRLTADEGERVTRLARIWALAVEVWGSEAEARAFLFRPHAMLEDNRPVDVAIRSELGAELVLGLLGALQYGSAA